MLRSRNRSEFIGLRGRAPINDKPRNAKARASCDSIDARRDVAQRPFSPLAASGFTHLRSLRPIAWPLTLPLRRKRKRLSGASGERSARRLIFPSPRAFAGRGWVRGGASFRAVAGCVNAVAARGERGRAPKDTRQINRFVWRVADAGGWCSSIQDGTGRL